MIVKLPLKDVRRGVAVGTAFLEVVVFLHGLIVEVLAVDDEEHLVDIGQSRGYLCGLERGQGFAAARGVPDVAASAKAPLPFVHRGLLDAQHDALGGGNLIGTHHEEVFVDREDAVFGQHVEQRGLGEEGLGEVAQVDDWGVFGISPIAGELKRLRLGLHLRLALVDGSHVGKPRCVAVVFRFGAVADDEHLHIIVEAASCPKRLPFIAVDLVEGFLQRHATTFQFAMHQRQAVDKDGHIITVGLGAAFGHVLVEHLNMVVVDVLLVDELHVLRSAVVAGDVDDFGALDAFGLVLDAHLGRGDMLLKELFPLLIRKSQMVQPFHLLAQVGDELRLGGDVDIFVALLHQLLDEAGLQCRFALVAIVLARQRLVVGHHRAVLLFRYDIEVFHNTLFLKKIVNRNHSLNSVAIHCVFQTVCSDQSKLRIAFFANHP